jgi:hypothetical protein
VCRVKRSEGRRRVWRGKRSEGRRRKRSEGRRRECGGEEE